MTDILIRGVPDDDAAALTAKAANEHMDRQTWLRGQLAKLAAEPTIRQRYSFKAVAEPNTMITITRQYGFVQRGARDCSSQAQFDAYQRACDYANRNDLGDYERAYKLLLEHFDEVFTS